MKLPLVAQVKLLTYADVCGRMRTYADVCGRMLTYADVCGRMLMYAEQDVDAKDANNAHQVRIFVADLDYNHNLYSTRRDWYRAYADVC